MVRIASLIEESLTDEALAALKTLVGCRLFVRMPWIGSHGDGSFICDKMVFVTPSEKERHVHLVHLEISEFETPVTNDYYYRYTILAVDEHESSIHSANPSSWVYGGETDSSSIKSIEIYSYESSPDQIKKWPDLEELSEALSFDFDLLLEMSDGGRVSIKPMYTLNLLSVTLRPSFEISQFKKKLGENLNLRSTIN